MQVFYRFLQLHPYSHSQAIDTNTNTNSTNISTTQIGEPILTLTALTATLIVYIHHLMHLHRHHTYLQIPIPPCSPPLPPQQPQSPRLEGGSNPPWHHGILIKALLTLAMQIFNALRYNKNTQANPPPREHLQCTQPHGVTILTLTLPLANLFWTRLVGEPPRCH